MSPGHNGEGRGIWGMETLWDHFVIKSLLCNIRGNWGIQYPVVIRNSYWSSWRTVGITLSCSLVFHWLLNLMYNIIELLSRFRSVTSEDFEVQRWLGYYQDFSFCDVWELEVQWRLFCCQNCAVRRMGNLSLSRFITFLSPPGAACWGRSRFSWGSPIAQFWGFSSFLLSCRPSRSCRPLSGAFRVHWVANTQTLGLHTQE